MVTSLVNIINIYIELQKSRQEAQTERDYLQNLYKHMPLGYLRARILYDQQQNPVDLLFTDANLAAKKITGKSNFNGLRLGFFIQSPPINNTVTQQGLSGRYPFCQQNQ